MVFFKDFADPPPCGFRVALGSIFLATATGAAIACCLPRDCANALLICRPWGELEGGGSDGGGRPPPGCGSAGGGRDPPGGGSAGGGRVPPGGGSDGGGSDPLPPLEQITFDVAHKKNDPFDQWLFFFQRRQGFA